MHIFVPKETARGETRAPLVPASVAKLAKLGAEVEIESQLGESIGYTDDDYAKAGAYVSPDAARSLGDADLVLRLRKPSPESIDRLKPGAIHISYLDPFNEHDLVRRMAARSISAISMELIPRTTLAQKMDALSSQANLAGYAAVILAADRLDRIIPMMMTPAGTISPAKVFVIGVGVAGLQAIATAKRLGARIEAFDTRPVVEDQVKSLGAKFVKINLGETGQTEQGYAKAITEEQLVWQRKGIAQHCIASDIVITAAQVFGRRAPVIVTMDTVEQMRPGSVVVDLAADSGGNVEGLQVDKEIIVNGVRLIGYTNLATHVPVHASQMYAANLANLIEHFWDKDAKTLKLDLADEIFTGCLVTHGGQIVHKSIRSRVEGDGAAG